MTRTLWKLGGCLALGMTALGMIFWGLERTTLVDDAVRVMGESETIPTHIYVLIFVGLVLLSLAGFAAITVWGGFLKANPTTRQLPIWIVLVTMVVSGAAMIAGFAQHSAYVQSLDALPTDVNQGYIAYLVITATAVIVCIVIMSARWAPGYRPILLRDR